MEGTLSIIRLKNADTFRVIFYGVEMPEGLDPAAAYIAKGMDALGSFLDAIGMPSDRQQAIRDALRIESSTSVFSYDIPNDVLKRFGLL
jgi:hypothetical protein